MRRTYRRGSYTAYPSPSKPGEPPRKRTGWLARNVTYEVDGKNGVARVGLTANARYGIYLELGTSRMAARPWLLVTARKLAPQLEAIFREEFS